MLAIHGGEEKIVKVSKFGKDLTMSFLEKEKIKVR